MDDTIPGRFARQAETLGNRTLFLVKQGGVYQPMSWQRAFDDVVALSAFLLHCRVNAGDRVLILSENRPEWAIADIAIQSIGAWTVPIYPSLTESDLRVICRDCEPAVGIVSNADQATKLVAVSRQITSIRTIIVMDGTQSGPIIVVPWADAVGKGRRLAPRFKQLLERRQAQIRPEQTATLIYTSGTTGEPKGVMLSHRNFLSNVEACLEVIPVTRNDLHLSFLPLSHVFERMAGWYLMFSVGASVAYAESMDTVPQNMLEVRPTIMLGVPRFFEKLYARVQEGLRQAAPLKRRLVDWAIRIGQASGSLVAAGERLPPGLALQRAIADRLVFQKFNARLGGRLRFFVSGSAALSKHIGEFFYCVGMTILEGYGLTETSPVITVNRLDAPCFGSVGSAVPGVEVAIAEDGEILTKGPHVMQGYYKRPEATAAAIVDGWFHTGDIGHCNAAGNLFITDRKKDLIKTAGGKFVAPQKLEMLFASDPYVSQVFVYGEKRPYCVALIVPNREQLRRYAQEQEITAGSFPELLTDRRVLEFYWSRIQEQQKQLASFEQVKKIALVDQEFTQAAGELTPTLKVKRGAVAQRYGALLESLYQDHRT